MPASRLRPRQPYSTRAQAARALLLRRKAGYQRPTSLMRPKPVAQYLNRRGLGGYSQ